MERKFYDIIIIGCGIAGLFTAYTLLKYLKNKQILILEKGGRIEERICSEGTKCSSFSYCPVLCGVGGAGSFSDGKITLDPYIGTHHKNLLNLPTKTISIYINQVHVIIKKVIPYGVYYGTDVSRKISDIEIMGYRGYHIGTDGVRILIKDLYNQISKKCNILLQNEAININFSTEKINKKYSVTYKRKNKIWQVFGDHLVIATGLEGTAFTEKILKDFNLVSKLRNSDIGIRLETCYEVFEKFMHNFYDFKIYYKSNNIDLRTFCVNHRGYVLTENHIGLNIKGVNGHSYIHKKSDNTNLSILATISLKKVSDPPLFVRNLARTINRESKNYPAY